MKKGGFKLTGVEWQPGPVEKAILRMYPDRPRPLPKKAIGGRFLDHHFEACNPGWCRFLKNV